LPVEKRESSPQDVDRQVGLITALYLFVDYQSDRLYGSFMAGCGGRIGAEPIKGRPERLVGKSVLGTPCIQTGRVIIDHQLPAILLHEFKEGVGHDHALQVIMIQTAQMPMP